MLSALFYSSFHTLHTTSITFSQVVKQEVSPLSLLSLSLIAIAITRTFYSLSSLKRDFHNRIRASSPRADAYFAMKFPTFLGYIATAIWVVSQASAQTYSQCNPLTGGAFLNSFKPWTSTNFHRSTGGCPPDTALGKSVNVNFASGPSDSFTPQGSPTYDSNGASLTVAKDGDSPQLTSKWYIMFGHVDFVIKAAPGTGIVSSAVLQSDDLDEIDWEWLGGDNSQGQSNYFGKGQAVTHNRGAFHAAAGNHDVFKTYSIDWTADQIVWSIDGQSVRALSSSTGSQYPYPQTPMVVKVGAWCGGCPSNAPQTIRESPPQNLLIVQGLTRPIFRMGRRSGQFLQWRLYHASQINCSDRLLDRFTIQVYWHGWHLAVNHRCGRICQLKGRQWIASGRSCPRSIRDYQQ